MLTTQCSQQDDTKSKPNRPGGLYSSYVKIGDQLYISGQTSRVDNCVMQGRLGDTLTIDDGKKAAQLCARNVLDQVDQFCYDNAAEIKATIKLQVFMQATESFNDHAKVADGASEYLQEKLGEQGRHCRTAVGVASLPRGAAVEIDAIFELVSD
ncbi:RidA family protein [Photobacterium leiognathi]|uniref:RidA family protein n=1 Tax=Photobacterium leiognathi TaxID=553611 RepID=UPI0029816CA9|nr:RidA family protein [Photobacterium leiognathi]